MSGKELKDLLSKYDISQSEVARRLGLSQQSFSQMLSSADVKTSLVERIARVLDVSISTLYAGLETAGQVSNGDNSPNVHGDGNSVHITTDGVLAERVKYLEALLSEKERLIRIYEKLLDK